MDLNNFLNMTKEEREAEIARYERMMDLVEENGRNMNVMKEQLEKMTMNLLNGYFYNDELARKEA